MSCESRLQRTSTGSGGGFVVVHRTRLGFSGHGGPFSHSASGIGFSVLARWTTRYPDRKVRLWKRPILKPKAFSRGVQSHGIKPCAAACSPVSGAQTKLRLRQSGAKRRPALRSWLILAARSIEVATTSSRCVSRARFPAVSSHVRRREEM